MVMDCDINGSGEERVGGKVWKLYINQGEKKRKKKEKKKKKKKKKKW